MKYLNLTFPTPEANLACDEALLDWCEEGREEALLRVWQPDRPFVVVGYANATAREVYVDACRKRSIPVLRRCSGGGTVLQGPGCLNFALCLKIDPDGPLATIPRTNRWIMEKHRQLFEHLLGMPVEVQGHTDLAVQGQKFSGNSQRRKRRFLLFHGSFLLGLDLPLMELLLAAPSKQPPYRRNRSHTDFVRNLPLSPAVVQDALKNAWNARDDLTTPPAEAVERLVADKYSRDEWNWRF